MPRLRISFPPTPYTNAATNQRLRELGAPADLLRENENRVDVIRQSVVLGSRMTWGEESETSIIIYTGAIPKGVETALRNLQARGVITSWGQPMKGQEGGTMVEDLMTTWEELGHMLADVGENYADMHPDDVIGILRNCELKATELTRQIAGRRQYVQEISALILATQSGADAGMPPGQGKPTVTGEGQGLL